MGLLALCAGLLIWAVAARVEVSLAAKPARALAAYRGELQDTPLEELGQLLLRRAPGLVETFALEQHRRWLLLVGPALSAAALVGLALLLAVAGLLLAPVTGLPLVGLAAAGLGFGAPFLLLRSRAQRVKARVQSSLPDLAALLAAEMAAGNPADVAIERTAEFGGPLARIIGEAVGRRASTHLPLFSRDRGSPGALRRVGERYDLAALRAFIAQVDLAARTGEAGPELMQDLANSLIHEYRDRALREAEQLETRLAVPSVLFFFLPFLFLILTPLLGPVIRAL